MTQTLLSLANSGDKDVVTIARNRMLHLACQDWNPLRISVVRPDSVRLEEGSCSSYAWGELIVAQDIPLDILDMCLMNGLIQYNYRPALQESLPCALKDKYVFSPVPQKLWVNSRVDKAVHNLWKNNILGYKKRMKFNGQYYNLKTSHITTALNLWYPELTKASRRLAEQKFVSLVQADISTKSRERLRKDDEVIKKGV